MGDDGVLVATIDMPERSMNVFSAGLMDSLEALLEEVAATPGVGKVHILAHSMGGWLTMEALRQASLSGHRDLDGHLWEIIWNPRSPA